MITPNVPFVPITPLEGRTTTTFVHSRDEKGRKCNDGYMYFVNWRYKSEECCYDYLIQYYTRTSVYEWYTSDGELHSNTNSDELSVITYGRLECMPTIKGQILGWSQGSGLELGIGINSTTGGFVTLGGHDVDINDPDTWVGDPPPTTIGTLPQPEAPILVEPSPVQGGTVDGSNDTGNEETEEQKPKENTTLIPPSNTTEIDRMIGGAGFTVNVASSGVDLVSRLDFIEPQVDPDTGSSKGKEGAKYKCDVTTAELIFQTYYPYLSSDARIYLTSVITSLRQAPPGTGIWINIRSSPGNSPGNILTR